MLTQKLRDTLNAIHPVSDELAAALDPCLIPMHLPRNHMLQSAPRVPDQAFFLEDGLAISFTYRNRRKIVRRFWFQSDIIFSPSGFFRKTPTLEHIQLLRDSHVLCLSYDHAKELMDRFPDANMLSHLILCQYLDIANERLDDCHELPLRERYRHLLQTYPGIDQQVTQELIASYLGITAQALSRMKHRSHD